MNSARGGSSSSNAAQCWVYRVLPSNWLIWPRITVIWPKKASHCSLLLGIQALSLTHMELYCCKMLPKVNSAHGTGVTNQGVWMGCMKGESGGNLSAHIRELWKQRHKRWDLSDLLNTGRVIINGSTWYSSGMWDRKNTVKWVILSPQANIYSPRDKLNMTATAAEH